MLYIVTDPSVSHIFPLGISDKVKLKLSRTASQSSNDRESPLHQTKASDTPSVNGKAEHNPIDEPKVEEKAQPRSFFDTLDWHDSERGEADGMAEHKEQAELTGSLLNQSDDEDEFASFTQNRVGGVTPTAEIDVPGQEHDDFFAGQSSSAQQGTETVDLLNLASQNRPHTNLLDINDSEEFTNFDLLSNPTSVPMSQTMNQSKPSEVFDPFQNNIPKKNVQNIAQDKQDFDPFSDIAKSNVGQNHTLDPFGGGLSQSDSDVGENKQNNFFDPFSDATPKQEQLAKPDIMLTGQTKQATAGFDSFDPFQDNSAAWNSDNSTQLMGKGASSKNPTILGDEGIDLMGMDINSQSNIPRNLSSSSLNIPATTGSTIPRSSSGSNVQTSWNVGNHTFTPTVGQTSGGSRSGSPSMGQSQVSGFTQQTNVGGATSNQKSDPFSDFGEFISQGVCWFYHLNAILAHTTGLQLPPLFISHV